jgi:AAA+ ATPase superfamily predicted ATPase
MEGVTMLLERERELQELRSALTEAQQERGQLLLIEGQAGLGKTSLRVGSIRISAKGTYSTA